MNASTAAHTSSAPVLIASWNGRPATARAAMLHAQGTPLLDALVSGITLVEDDPEEMSVGFGGLPNENGTVELDAAVMDGPMHRAGAVAGLRDIRHASGVALEVLRRTDHALLVGEGARDFAIAVGFTPENLLTPASRSAWLQWKAGLSPRDAWISPDEAASDFDTARWAGHRENPTPGRPPEVPFTYGTIHVSGLDARGDLYSCTSTSGLSYKIAGRVGDSPIVGAGLYTDNSVGSAGATGRGEASMLSCASYDVVRGMESGLSPVEACLEALRRLARHTKPARLLSAPGRPAFNVTMYALRKDGVTGSASLHEGYTHVVQRGNESSLEPSAFLFAAEK